MITSKAYVCSPIILRSKIAEGDCPKLTQFPDANVPEILVPRSSNVSYDES